METKRIMVIFIVVILVFESIVFGGVSVNAQPLIDVAEDVSYKECALESENVLAAVSENTPSIKYSGIDGSLYWTIDDCGHLSVTGNGNYGEFFSTPEWCSYNDEIYSATVSVNGITKTEYMFYDCAELVTINLSNLDTSQVTNMASMFDGCSSLSTLDVKNFDTSNVEYMNGMFSKCSNLINLDLSSFRADNVLYTYLMFDGCSSLTSLDLSNFNTGNLIGMHNMFDGCSSLSTLDVKNFDTTNVTQMGGVFKGCSSLSTLDLSGWDTKNATFMYAMFEGCSNLKSLDISNFDTSKIDFGYLGGEKCGGMDNMFKGCFNLSTIYAPTNRSVCDMKLPEGEGAWKYLPSGQTATLITKGGTYVRDEVNLLTLFDINIAKMPTKTKYVEGERFDKTGLIVMANYSDGSSEDVTNKVEILTEVLKTTDKNVVVRFEGKTAAIPVSVSAKQEEEKIEVGDATVSKEGSYAVTEIKEDGTVEVEFRPSADAKKQKTVTVDSMVTIEGKSYPVTAIADNAFKGDTKVKTVKLPKTIETIGDNAFSGCKNLTKVDLSKTNTKTIGKNAFKGTKITTVKLPTSTTTIKATAFANCDKLKTITLGKNTIKVAANAFKGSKNIKKITFKSDKVPSKKDIKGVKGLSSKVTIKVPKKQKDKYIKVLRAAGFKGKIS